MKNSANFVSKLALGLAIAGSIAACNQKTESKPAATAATPDKATTVFINQDSLLSKYEYFKDMTARLEEKSKAAQADITSRGQAIQREYAEVQRNAATMSADQQAAAAQRFQRKGQDFETYRQNAGAEIQNQQVTEQGKLYDKVADFLKGYAKEKGYKLILTYKRGEATVMYGDPSLDVTADVVKRLNEAYAKDKK